MFFHSNVVLVHQTSKRKRVIAEPEGAPAKSLKNVVVPEKSDSAPLILAVQPVTQNIGPTPTDCTHTSLATPLAPPHRTCTQACTFLLLIYTYILRGAKKQMCASKIQNGYIDRDIELP